MCGDIYVCMYIIYISLLYWRLLLCMYRFIVYGEITQSLKCVNQSLQFTVIDTVETSLEWFSGDYFHAGQIFYLINPLNFEPY